MDYKFIFLLFSIFVIEIQSKSTGLTVEKVNNNEDEELRNLVDELKERKKSIKSRNLELKQSLSDLDRHTNTRSTLFSAHQTAGSICGTGTITNWVEDIDLGSGNSAGTAAFASGVFTTGFAGYYFIHASFRCDQVNNL